RAYWRRARQAGYKVGAFTIIPAATDQNNLMVRRFALYDLIRSAPAEYDVLFDVALLPELQDPTNTSYFKPDGVHLTALASQAIANLINYTVILPGVGESKRE
ncbi:MAG TPA: hypothetical protein VGR78_18295, partial [Verrucomicrobiae bacterium]|nr:hypothetical protein [Verrucomicrobiae bacterium]